MADLSQSDNTKKEKNMKLRDYISSTALSVRAFCRLCDISFGVVRNSLDGRIISLPSALLIEKATNGQVTPLDLCAEDFQKKLKNFESPFNPEKELKKKKPRKKT